MGVTDATLEVSLGTSATRATLDKSALVTVSVPPLAMIRASVAANPSTKKYPSLSVAEEGSSASCCESPLRSINTLAPANGPSTTRPSKASATLMIVAARAESEPSDTDTLSS